MKTLYTVGFYLAIPFILLRLLWRGRKLPAYRQHIAERVGHYGAKPLRRSIWVHAVSYGETVAAEPLIKALLKTYQGIPIVVTHMTPTGRARAEKTFGDQVLHCYIPYDVPCIIKRFVKRFNPMITIIMETELWPNILHTLGEQTPIIIASARLSEKSAQGYLKMKSMCTNMLKSINHVAAQSKADEERFQRIGLACKNTSVLGNMKFDITYPEDLIAQGKSLRQELSDNRPVWIAASTHEGEEEKVLKAFKAVKKSLPNALLILVPRHPDRFNLVANLCKQKGYETIRRSENKKLQDSTDILLGDTMGEMYLFYAAADVAFLAGSFAPIGGHNLLEPALVGLPVLTGPHLFNSVEISELLITAGNTQVVADEQELACSLLTLFQDKNKRDAMGEKGQQVIQMHKGALERHMDLIAGYL